MTSSALILACVGPTALAYVLLVGRAKRCLDFSATIFIAHVIATICHSGIPRSATWWCLNVIATSLMAFVGEAVCMKLELQEISVSAAERGTRLPPLKPPASSIPSDTIEPQDPETGEDLQNPLMS